MTGTAFRAVDRAAETTLRTLGAIALLITLAVIPAVLVFRLSIGGSLALYFIVWWTVVFAVLPFAARRGALGGEAAVGAEPGAPAEPRLREHAIWTTLWSDLVFLMAVAAFPLAGL